MRPVFPVWISLRTRLVTCCRGPSGVCGGCTTRRQNAHGTGFERELLYPWHPWTGRRVFVHEVIDKNEAAVFRCSLSGRGSDRRLEVPAWMFDRVPSTSWRITVAPHVDLAALGALGTLLRDTGASSQSREMGAALGSHDANRGDVHAAQAHDIPVRSVLEAERRRDDADAAMAKRCPPRRVDP